MNCTLFGMCELRPLSICLEGPRSGEFQVKEKMFEQYAARIVNQMDTTDDLATGMLAHNLTDKQLNQAY
jgi:hypothetical protein